MTVNRKLVEIEDIEKRGAWDWQMYPFVFVRRDELFMKKCLWANVSKYRKFSARGKRQDCKS